MIFAEEIVLSCFEKKGFTSLSQVRSVKGCRWYEGKNEGRFFEIEVYSPEFLADPDLDKYLDSLKCMPENLPFLRRPTHIHEKRNYTFVFREGKNFKPLTDYLLRPGAISEQRARRIILSFEHVQKYLQENPMENFSPLAVLFKFSSSEKVCLDSFRCGPWIKNYPEINVIYSYLNLDLDWERQLKFFKNKLSLKLFLGDVESFELGKSFENESVKKYLNGILAEDVEFNKRLCDFEFTEKSVFSFNSFTGFLVASSLLFLLIFQYRYFQPGKTWQGVQGNEGISNINESNEERIAVGDKRLISKVNHQNFENTFREIARQLALGQFNEVILNISSLKSLELAKADRQKLNDLQAKLPELIKEDYSEVIKIVERSLSNKDYEFAFKLVSRHQSYYPGSTERNDLLDLLMKIELEKQQETSENTISQKADLILNDRKLIERVAGILNSPVMEPLKELSLKRRQLMLVKGEMKSPAAIYIIDCWNELVSAEEALMSNIINGSASVKQKLYIKLKSEKTYNDLEFEGVSQKGFEYRDLTGGATLEFSQLAPNVMLKLFRESASSERDLQHYQQFLYCLKHKMYAESEVELKMIRSLENLANASRFRDLEEAQHDLWKPLGN